MISKIIFFTNALLLVSAQHYDQGSYGHATSSQSIIRHDDVGHNQHVYNVPAYHQPIAIHSSPLTQYASVSHNPIAYNVAPTHRYASIAHVAPVTYNAGPIIHRSPVTAFRRIGVASNYAAPAITLQHSNYYNQYQNAYAHQDYNAYPKYEFEYSVQDTHTGDIKSQHEARDGDQVNGFYSLHEPDGSVRTVHYNVAGHSGFNAQVERTGHSTHVQPERHYAPQYALAHHL